MFYADVSLIDVLCFLGASWDSTGFVGTPPTTLGPALLRDLPSRAVGTKVLFLLWPGEHVASWMRSQPATLSMDVRDLRSPTHKMRTMKANTIHQFLN